MSDADGKYVYGVVPAVLAAPSLRGIRGKRVKKVVFDEIAAIVSDVPAGGGELRVEKEDLMGHSRVLEKVLERGAVIPLRFGTVMADSEAVREELLERFHDGLATQLEQLEGRVEVHLRTVYEEGRLMAEIVESDRDIARLREALADQPPDATYYERIRLGEMVAEAVERARERDLEVILQSLAPLAVASDVGPVEHERIVASISFLVDGHELDAFDEAVNELGRLTHDRMRFKYTGPLPAYSFVELPG
jgi:signal transduction histidine kinase